MKIIIVPCIPKMFGRRLSLARTLAEQGHEVHYITWELPYRISALAFIKHCFTSLKPEKYPYENFTMHKVSRLPFFWPFINGWLFKYQIRKLYRHLNANIVISQSYTNETAIPKELPLVYDLNDDHVAMAEVYGSRIYKLAFRLLRVRSTVKKQCEQAVAVTVVSEALYKLAKNYNSNVLKLPNGVNNKVIEDVRKDKSTYSKNKHSIVYVTGFNQWSRPIETIQTVVKLKKLFPDIELTLIGEGTETEKIKRYIKKNDLHSYIHYLGAIYDQKKLFSLINQSTIGLNISEKNKLRDAAQPLKVLEYSALDKKVVSTDLEEVKALNFANVYIFSDSDKTKKFAKVLEEALRAKNTSSSVGNTVLSTYSWDKIAKDLIKLIAGSKE